MIQSTDFKEKQVLFVDTRSHKGKSALRFQNSNFLYLKDDKPVNKISCHNLIAVFLIGEMTLTTQLIRQAKEHGVSLYFLKHNFAPYASVGANAEAHYLLRQRQYTMSEEENMEVARHLVINKIKNQARLLGLKTSSAEVKEAIQKAKSASDMKSLLGVEGNFSKKFFSEYFAEIDWRRRAPRTREDIPNLLLDIGYTVLFNFIDSLLRLYGFDIYKGVYHQLFFGRKSLVSDVQEPFRSIVDKALLKGYKLSIVDENDFNFNTRKREFELPWKNASKYYRLFADEIMDRKMEIFAFVQAFYRHIMLPSENKLASFNINKNYNKK